MLQNALALIVKHLPDASLLPFGSDAILVAGIGYTRFLIGVFPPLGIMLAGFLVVLAFKTGMMIVSGIPVIGRIIRAYQ